MPESDNPALRLFCVCGQKMKVSGSMYGLPGKCIACRLKIRLPREDEIPEGIGEIHLKDYPHLIRKKKKNAKQQTNDAQKALDSVPMKAPSEGAPTPVTELDIADSAQVSREHVAGSRPLDPMDSLQKIASLELKFERRLKSVDQSKDKTLHAELSGHLKRIKNVRDGLDEHMRQLLMEVAIELTNTQEKISQAQIAARVGEIPLDQFQDSVYRLRHRRDRLERRQLNLRGWLAATDPFNVGGFIDVSIEDIPEDGFTLPVPTEPEESSTLLNAHAANLKHAFDVRKNTEYKMTEIKRLGDASEGEEKGRLADTYNTTKGTRRIAKAQIQFYRQRLEQLIRDYKNDLETLESQLETARDKLSMDQMGRTEFDAIERHSSRTKIDIAKGIGLAQRLLHANSLDDVPEPRGTFLQRLGFGNGNTKAKRFSLALWSASLLWLLGILLPTVGSTSLLKAFSDFSGTGSNIAILLVLPVFAAIASAAISFLMRSHVRSIALMGLWSLTALLLAYFINEANFSLDPVANRFRSGTTWWLRPGMVAMLVANGLLLFSAASTVSANKKLFRSSIISGLFILFLTTWIATNGLDLYLPKPIIEDNQEAFSAETRTQSGSMRISNEGSRTLHLVSRRTSARNGFLYTIEKKIGGNSFSEISPDGSDIGAITAYTDISVSPGTSTDIPYELPPGDYRLLLIPHVENEEIEKAFSIIDPNPIPASTEDNLSRKTNENGSVIIEFDTPLPDPVPVQDSTPETPRPRAVNITKDSLPAVELSGIITGADGNPHFSLELFTENSSKGSILKVSLNDPLINDWIVSEYNPSQSTVTLKKDSKYLILRRGERVTLSS